MDKQAFKQRMQNLKSYRENNPGKGYIQFMEELAKAKSKEWKEDEDMTLLQMLNDNTYNYKQMYEDNPDYNIQEGHFKDTYKTVYHPTFSNESMYSGQKSQYNPEGIIGGWWDYDNKIFHANPKQDLNYTQWYLDREDPGWKVQAKDMPQIGKMEAKASAKTRYNDTGVGAGPNDFDFLVNVDRPIDAKEIARHEMNHYTDYLISRNPNTTTNNNMLKQLESSLKNTDEKEYFRRGTEQKAYMNQLRARMYEDGAISSLDELVTPSMIKSYIDKLGDKDSIKRAYKQHKSLSSYTKWFNSIPLLGVGAIGVNKYFNNGTEQEK